MRVKLGIALAALSLLLACGRSTTRPTEVSELSGGYLIQDMNVSFRVPAGWAEPKSWNALKRKSYAARFDAPGGDASLTAGRAPFAGINCAAAAQKALATANGADLEVGNEFELKTNRETLSAGAATTSSDKRRGVARYFCRAQSVVVVEAAANKSAFEKHQAELESIVGSVNFEGDGQKVAIRPPASPPPAFFQHTVKFRGQTLGRIAEWYTGDYDNWKKLARYNDLAVPNVSLKPGRIVKIPVELVVRQDPIPEPKRSRAGRSSPPTATTGQKPVDEPVAAQPKEAPAIEPNPSEEEEAETTGVAPKLEEEPAALPPVIGPR